MYRRWYDLSSSAFQGSTGRLCHARAPQAMPRDIEEAIIEGEPLRPSMLFSTVV
jgi:hypothetical protein